jgi:hypothetical protein
LKQTSQRHGSLECYDLLESDEGRRIPLKAENVRPEHVGDYVDHPESCVCVQAMRRAG